MIGFFTDPHPDELLYSACARYHRRARNRSKESTARDLFGKGQTKIIVDFQTRLDYLAAQLPPTTYSASRLIDEHTMLPFYVPFMPAERHEALRRGMRVEGGGSVHARLGVLTSGLNVERLRFCVACAEEDRARATCGEPYWHRVHQVPGVEVCPSHAVFLSESAVRVRNRGSHRAFVTARQAIDEMPPESRTARPLDLEKREHQILLRLARDAEWVLNARVGSPGLDVLRRRYLRLLFERGLAAYMGKVRHVRLEAQFLDYCTPELLDRLGCGLGSPCHWLRRLVNDWARTRHPLHHLLLMQFLGCPAEEFFRLPLYPEPFGKGPWPCLNAAGGHYLEARVTECLIGHTQDESRRPTGTFRCACGFSYKRVGPDTTDERRYRYDLIMSLGEAWYEKLREMLAAGSHSRPEMARALGVPVGTVNGEIKKLKKSNESGLPPSRRYQKPRSHPAVSRSEICEIHRKRWRETVIERPDESRSKLRHAAPEAYDWLVKNDKEWLDQNSPEPRVSSGTSPRVSWPKRDQMYAAAARETAAKMLNAQGRPVRASRSGIAQELGILAVVNKHSDKLPQTNKALDEVAESLEAFAIRRISWAADCYRQEQVAADPWKLVRQAAVGTQMAGRPKVKAACEECAQALRCMNERGWEGSANTPE